MQNVGSNIKRKSFLNHSRFHKSIPYEFLHDKWCSQEMAQLLFTRKYLRCAMEWSVSHVGNHDSRRQSWVMTFPQKKNCFLRCVYRPEVRDGGNHESRRQSWVTSAIMTHVGNHDSRQSTALLYQFLRWNLSCKISWVGRNFLFKLGFLVPLRRMDFHVTTRLKLGLGK
jgi:hypothetical protein